MQCDRPEVDCWWNVSWYCFGLTKRFQNIELKSSRRETEKPFVFEKLMVCPLQSGNDLQTSLLCRYGLWIRANTWQITPVSDQSIFGPACDDGLYVPCPTAGSNSIWRSCLSQLTKYKGWWSNDFDFERSLSTASNVFALLTGARFRKR